MVRCISSCSYVCVCVCVSVVYDSLVLLVVVLLEPPLPCWKLRSLLKSLFNAINHIFIFVVARIAADKTKGLMRINSCACVCVCVSIRP